MILSPTHCLTTKTVAGALIPAAFVNLTMPTVVARFAHLLPGRA